MNTHTKTTPSLHTCAKADIMYGVHKICKKFTIFEEMIYKYIKISSLIDENPFQECMFFARLLNCLLCFLSRCEYLLQKTLLILAVTVELTDSIT